MKRLLLDTHSLIWVVRNDPALVKTAARAFETAEEIYCSVVSFWEPLHLERGDFLPQQGFFLPQTQLGNNLLRRRHGLFIGHGRGGFIHRTIKNRKIQVGIHATGN